MDLLASIFAYFATVTAIILAPVIFYAALVYAPSHSKAPPYALTLAARPSGAKAAATQAATARREVPATRSESRRVAGAKTAPEADAAARLKIARRRNAQLRKDYMRRLARQARAHEWASQQSSQALGYADGPRAVFGYGPFH
jgi:hypothetical protein